MILFESDDSDASLLSPSSEAAAVGSVVFGFAFWGFEVEVELVILYDLIAEIVSDV